MQGLPENSRRERDKFIIMAFCGAMAANSLRRNVFMPPEEGWDRDVTQTDFIQNYRMSRATLNLLRVSPQDSHGKTLR